MVWFIRVRKGGDVSDADVSVAAVCALVFVFCSVWVITFLYYLQDFVYSLGAFFEVTGFNLCLFYQVVASGVADVSLVYFGVVVFLYHHGLQG